ncbi:MAG: LysR family transcriptional regulator [Desulfuromonadales bacterium]|nr:LysR family transcriptional regulator [Desulfuromonadales bacterium]
MNEETTELTLEDRQKEAGRNESACDVGIWINRTNPGLLKNDHINLLLKIDECGSIVKAARMLGISYKSAWDAINAINNNAGTALVYRLAVGTGCGITVLTDEGKKFMYRSMTETQKRRKP